MPEGGAESAPINRTDTSSSQKANGYIPMRVKDALTNQHWTVLSLAESQTVADAITKMMAAGASALIVTSGGQPTGLFTRSDVMRVSVDSPRQSFAAIPLKEALAGDFIWTKPEDDIVGVIDTMLRKRIQFLPVREDGQVIAVLSIQDLVAWHLEALNAEIEHLNDYIHQLHDSLED